MVVREIAKSFLELYGLIGLPIDSKNLVSVYLLHYILISLYVRQICAVISSYCY